MYLCVHNSVPVMANVNAAYVKKVPEAIIPQPLFFCSFETLDEPQNDSINAEPISSESKETS